MKRGLLLLLCVMQSFIFVLHAQNTQRNIAYTDGNVRFTVISDGAIRLEYAPDGKFVDDRSHIVVNRNYPQVDYKLKTRGGWVEMMMFMLVILTSFSYVLLRLTYYPVNLLAAPECFSSFFGWCSRRRSPWYSICS